MVGSSEPYLVTRIIEGISKTYFGVFVFPKVDLRIVGRTDKEKPREAANM
jgi:hypothetical protein